MWLGHQCGCDWVHWGEAIWDDLAKARWDVPPHLLLLAVAGCHWMPLDVVDATQCHWNVLDVTGYRWVFQIETQQSMPPQLNPFKMAILMWTFLCPILARGAWPRMCESMSVRLTHTRIWCESVGLAPSSVIKRHQVPSGVIKCHQASSSTVRRHQVHLPSGVVRLTHARIWCESVGL